MVGEFGRNEAVASHRAHGSEHARVLDPAPLELLDDHPLARFRQVHRHPPTYTKSRRRLYALITSSGRRDRLRQSNHKHYVVGERIMVAMKSTNRVLSQYEASSWCCSPSGFLVL